MTPTPFWDRAAGSLFMHHWKIADIGVARGDGTPELLNQFEDEGWPDSIEVKDPDIVKNLRGYISFLNNKKKLVSQGLRFHVSQKCHVRWEPIL
jgi:hypothetical protein